MALTGLCSQRNGHQRARIVKQCKLSSSVVKGTKSRNGSSLWLQPRNSIQANLALWLEAGRARESGRQIIWSSNPGLSTNFLCLRYHEEQSDTRVGEKGVGHRRKRGGGMYWETWFTARFCFCSVWPEQTELKRTSVNCVTFERQNDTFFLERKSWLHQQ